MDSSDNFDNPAWPPIPDEAYRPAFVHPGHIHRNRYPAPAKAKAKTKATRMMDKAVLPAPAAPD